MNPSHSIPTIVDEGFVLWESRAIMQYLCNKYDVSGTLYPREPKKRAIVDRWLNFDITLMGSYKYGVMMKAFGGADPPEDKIIAMKNNLKLFDQLIGDNKYLTGDDLTIADLALLVTNSALLLANVDLSEYPNVKRWLTSLTTGLPYFTEFNVFDPKEMEVWVAKSQAYLKRQFN
ncbi:unnamed protein product [Oppiella nova]|uniref:Glutathione S-transferase n=1 Tax=Oppiella nova TaxID=334625 RepID=A0A7R9QHU2_9ACAR|nr:unnamed protein product [Oppiella nova]CAG2166244.1 unnamed protein product [Oppiella nova]